MKYPILQYALAKGIGEVAIKRAIYFIQNNNFSWEELYSQLSEFSIELKLNNNLINNINNCKDLAEEIEKNLRYNNIELLIENQSQYPQYLRKTLGDNCPSIIFAKGNLNLLNTVSVGFCGSRKVSAKGVEITAKCAEQLVEKNVTVISGYASGTDLASHKSALINSGNTVFVLAEGIFRYSIKKDIKALLSDNNHVFVSQFMPTSTWNAGNAMKRNSIIIGLSRAMILVESGKTGGTFAAGEESLKVKCPLFVIDFAKPEVSAEANPYFIQKGGVPIRGKDGIPFLDKMFYLLENDARIKSNSNEEETITSYQQLRLD